MLDTYNLIKNLNKLCDALHEKYCINCGGCCYVASEIAKHFDKLNIKYKLCILNDYSLDLDEITQEVRGNYINDDEYNSVSGDHTCCHYYLSVNNKLINKGNFKDNYYYNYIITNVDHLDIKWLYENSDWSAVYDRKKNKLIERIINLYFKKYENNLYINKGKPVSKMQTHSLTEII